MIATQNNLNIQSYQDLDEFLQEYHKSLLDLLANSMDYYKYGQDNFTSKHGIQILLSVLGENIKKPSNKLDRNFLVKNKDLVKIKKTKENFDMYIPFISNEFDYGQRLKKDCIDNKVVNIYLLDESKVDVNEFFNKYTINKYMIFTNNIDFFFY